MSRYRYPVKPTYTPKGGGFGSTILDNGQPRTTRHTGEDWSRNAGEAIYAAHAGVVVHVGYNPDGWGHYVWIKGDDGKFYGYAHMASTPRVRAGQRVTTSTMLGHVGDTGNTTGAHLHFVISKGTQGEAFELVWSKLVDPVEYLAPRVDPLEPHERQVKDAASLNVRSAPSPTSTRLRSLAAGSRFAPAEWLPGAKVQGIDVWYALKGGGYVWAGGTTTPGTAGLPAHVADTDPVEPDPDPPTGPAAPTPDPQPEAPAEPDPDQEEPMTPTPPPNSTTPPTVPADVILPRHVRGPLLLGTWLVGSAIGAANVGVVYAIAQGQATYPLWLGIATAVFGFASSQVAAIARANLNPPQ